MNFRLAIGLALTTFSVSAGAAEEKDFAAFFNKYETLSGQYDITVAGLYSDQANILAVRVLPDGSEQKMAIDGKKWKQLIVDSMDIAKQRGDSSKFSDVSFTRDGDGMKITASRYSAIKCFQDKDYYMILKEREDGQIEIVEEFTRSPQKSNCEKIAENDLVLVLQATVKAVSKQLPVMLDSDTRLEKISSEGKVLTYQYELVNYASKDLDAIALMKAVKPMVIKQTCTTPNLKSIVDQGGTVSYLYDGKDKVQVIEINVNKQNCPSS